MIGQCPYCKDPIEPTDVRVELETYQEEETWTDEPINEGPVVLHAGCLMGIINNKMTYNRSDLLAGKTPKPKEPEA